MTKNILLLIASLVLLAASSQGQVMYYDLDVTQNNDTIDVILTIEGGLEKEHSVFQFAATAPGTYQTMNIGRFVSHFQAFDKKGKKLEVSFNAPNQYTITKPQRVDKITYKVAETFDTQVKAFPIYLMCGSSVEADHALINAHTVMGYFHGLQDAPIKVGFRRNPNWKVGTALAESDGYFTASDYDHLVDSPILLGNLTVADTMIAETKVEIYTYSQNGMMEASALLSNMSDMLDAAWKFLVDLPVDRYTFLYHFESGLQGQTGAWEHAYSSEYVLEESDPTPEYMARVTDLASHEFFHIVTPLNIHSEVIEQFNFVEPTPSIHLWLYEGVTEWASNILLYRGEVIDLDTYLENAVAQKIYVDKHYYNRSWSLKKLAEESFNPQGAKQYANVYYRGSLMAGLLDILLLDLSDGTYGLRELILDLIKDYGKEQPFSEQHFISDITERTYPEVGAFFENHVLNSKPLPHQVYLNKIGLKLRTDGRKQKITRMKKLSARQQMLFEAWSKNLDLD